MILVTGGTGFIGQHLVRHLSLMEKPVRILLHPSRVSPSLPRGIPVEVAVSSFKDNISLRGALKGIHTIYHLAGAERDGGRADLEGVDINSAQMIAAAAEEAGVRRIIYLSHLGADRASAFPLLKAKGIAEGCIMNSGVTYTILRSAVVFGKNDHFTTALVRLMKMMPAIFPIPGDGSSVLQPLWVEDLVTCLGWAAEDEKLGDQIISVGGADYLSFRQIVEKLMAITNINRRIYNLTPAYLRIIALWVEQAYPNFPVSTFLIDYLASDRIASLDTLPRSFGLMPARFEQQLDYLKNRT